MSDTYIIAEQESAAQLTITDPDRDTTGKTVRLYIGTRPFGTSDERGSAATSSLS